MAPASKLANTGNPALAIDRKNQGKRPMGRIFSA
jgi:hypothetical protein